MVKSLTVRNSGIVMMQRHEDPPDGNLFIGTTGSELPICVKRVYYINALDNQEAIRGKHAHRELQQVIFCINGSFVLTLDDGTNIQQFLMNDPGEGVVLGKMLWHEMKGFSHDCVILVLADDVYKESDYIRSYELFKELTKNESNGVRLS